MTWIFTGAILRNECFGTKIYAARNVTTIYWQLNDLIIPVETLCLFLFRQNLCSLLKENDGLSTVLKSLGE